MVKMMKMIRMYRGVKAGCLDEDKRCFGQRTVRLRNRLQIMVVGEVDTGKTPGSAAGSLVSSTAVKRPSLR